MKIVRLLFGCVAVLSVWGCGGDANTGRLTIQITDAPFPFELVRETTVTIDKVEVHVSNSPTVASGFLTLTEIPQTFNLLELQGGVTATLLDADLEAGKYGQIRLLVSSASVTLTDDRVFDLEVPSGDTSGIKIVPKPHIVVEGGLTTDLILDFDVSQSFVPTPGGNPNSASEIEGFHFKPVIRVANASTVGSISGTVYDNNNTPGDPSDDVPLEGATVTASAAGSVITSTPSGLDGGYVLSGLDAGPYDVMAEMAGYETATRFDISVAVANQTSGTNFRLTSP
jgi:hypothetical protein